MEKIVPLEMEVKSKFLQITGKEPFFPKSKKNFFLMDFSKKGMKPVRFNSFIKKTPKFSHVIQFSTGNRG